MVGLIFGRIWSWVIAGFGIVAFLATIYAKGRTDGSTKEQIRQKKETDNAIREKREIENDVADDSDSDLDDRLQRWVIQD